MQRMGAEKLKILQLHFTISNHVITVAKNLVLMVNIINMLPVKSD